MLWLKLVDNVKTTLATNNLVVRADLFNACTDFHPDHTPIWCCDTLLNLILCA